MMKHQKTKQTSAVLMIIIVIIVGDNVKLGKLLQLTDKVCNSLSIFYITTVHIYIIIIIYVTGFEKTDHIVTIDISRKTDLKY